MRVAGALIALVLLASSCGGDAEPETSPSDAPTADSADDPFGIAGLSDTSTARAYCETEDFAEAMEEVLAAAIDGPPQSSGIEPLRGPTYDCRFGAQYDDVYVSVSIGLQGGVAPSELHRQTIEAMGRTQVTAVRDERTDDRYLIVQDANGGGLSDGAALGLRYKSSTLAVLVEAVSNADRFEEAEAIALALERVLPRLAAEATGDFSNQTRPSAPERTEIVARFDGEPMGISPDGRLILVADDEAGVCLYEVDSAELRFCNQSASEGVDVDAGEQMLFGNDDISWSADSTMVAFSNSANPDAAILDVSTGVARNINDDGLWDNSAPGEAPRDGAPRWLEPNRSVVFVQFGADTDALVVVDVETSSETARIELPSVERNDRLRPRIDPKFAPLVADPETVYLTGDGAVFVAHIGEGVIEEVVDYADTYDGVAPNLVHHADLAPVALIDDSTMLVGDFTVTQSAPNTGAIGGSTAGFLLLDLGTAALTPVFPAENDGWLGPTAMWLAADGRESLAWWVEEGAVYDPIDVEHGTVSHLDLDAEIPADPRDLPVAWNRADAVGAIQWSPPRSGVIGLQTWAAGRRIAVGTWEGETLVLAVASASNAPSPADDETAAPTTDGSMDLQIVVSDESSIDAAVSHVETELAAAGFSIDEWEVSTDDNRITVVVQGVGESQVAEFSIGASAGDSALEARPVVAVAPDAAAAEADALEGEQVEDANGLILVLRDGVSLAGEVTATASFTSAWTIDLTFTGSGLDAFNGIANQCFARGPQCLSGRLALVYGDRVLTAPTVQAPSFDSNQLLISGSFSEAEANELATAINGGGFFEIVEIAKRFEPA